MAVEVLQQVRQLDAPSLSGFANAPESLAAWRSVSNTVGPARSSGAAGSGAVMRSHPQRLQRVAGSSRPHDDAPPFTRLARALGDVPGHRAGTRSLAVSWSISCDRIH